MQGGWLKLHRKSMSSAVWENANTWRVWCWCLIRANHTQTKILFNSTEVTLQPGEFISGRFAGAQECNMRPSTFWSQILRLKKLRNIDTTSDSRHTVFTIVNWQRYQSIHCELDSNSGTNSTETRHRQKEEEKNGSLSGIPLFFRGSNFSVSQNALSRYRKTFALSDETLIHEFERIDRWIGENCPMVRSHEKLIMKWLGKLPPEARASPKVFPMPRVLSRENEVMKKRLVEGGLA